MALSITTSAQLQQVMNQIDDAFRENRNSEDPFVPQWVQCCLCSKWRIHPVRKNNDESVQNPRKRRKLNQAIGDCQSDNYKEEIKKLETKNMELQQRVDKLDVNRERLNAMNMDQLMELKEMMLNKVRMIREAEKRIVVNMSKCIACLDNQKNIAFDSCEHIALCIDCESKMTVKQCPICRTAYSNTKRVKLC